MKRRITAFTLFLVMIFSVTAFSATSFTDITEESHPWAYEAVEKMTEKGIITGTSQTTFAPNSTVTRIQALLLLSRILGYNSSAVKENIKDIYAIYEDELADLSTTYKNELAFLAFTGVFYADEFAKMDLNGGVSREEAAMFLAKADGVSDEMLKDAGEADDIFTDDKEITAKYKQYVYYVRDKGYMTGVGTGVFSPKTTVTRAQIATMLYRIMPNINYTYERAIVDSANEDGAKVYMNSKTYELMSDAVIRNKAEEIEASALYPDLYGIAKVADEEIVQYDVFFDAPVVDKTIDGLVAYISEKTSVVRIEDLDTENETNYKLLENRYKVTINGKESTLSQLRVDDYVVLELDSADRILSITVEDTSEELTDLTIEEIEITDSDTLMTVSDKNGKEYVFDMNKSEPAIRKNGNVVSFSSLSEGDKISKLQLLYNRIKSIDVYSEISATKGTITTIHISDASYIVITNGGKESTVNLNKDTTYYIYGETKNIYGLELGQNVNITLDGKNVSKVEVTVASQTGDVKGIVSSVNSSAGLVSVETADGQNIVVYVSTKPNSITKIIDNNSSSTINKKLSDIEVGASITALGAMVGGIFEATTIVYSNK